MPRPSPHLMRRGEWRRRGCRRTSLPCMAERERIAATTRRLADAGRRRRCSRAFMAICISVRCWWPTATSIIIDFEGEPAKPVDERRAKNQPAARRRRHAPLVRLCGRGDEAQERCHPGACRRSAARRIPADVSSRRAAQCFLAGYAEVLPRRGRRRRNEMLLTLFLIEKAAYEIAYEAANRPAWIDVPLHGLSPNSIATGASHERHGRTFRGLPRGVAEALAAGTLGDPFAVLGPHDTAMGRDRRVPSCLARWRSRSLRATDGAPLGRLAPTHAAGPVRRRGEQHASRTCCASPGRTLCRKPKIHIPSGLLLGDLDLHLFNEGRHFELASHLGASAVTIDGVSGVRFAVWAPNARAVSVVGDFNTWDPGATRCGCAIRAGVWELFIPRLGAGARYKFAIVGRTDGGCRSRPIRWRARPNRRRPPPLSSRIPTPSCLARRDWMQQRAHAGTAPTRRSRSTRCMPHPGSHPDGPHRRPGTSWPNGWCPMSARWASRHIELMPITEHPFGGSWGYQPLGLFAPSARFGPPEGSRASSMPATAPISASSSIGCRRISRPMPTAWRASTARRSTSTHDPREGFHQDWNTYIYNFGRREVQGFLIASALHWLEHFHVDGLRVDAVASMLYRDYSRKPANGFPTSTAAARTSRRSTSCAISMRSSASAARARSRSPRNRPPGPASHGRSRGRPGLFLQVEHGLDARHAALHRARPRPSRVASRRHHLRPALRVLRELHAAAVA